MDTTTKITIHTEHDIMKKVIEKAICEAAKRIKEGSAILPEKKDMQKAFITVTEILTKSSPINHTTEHTQKLVDLYIFTLAQATSTMLYLFDINTDEE